MLEYDVTLVEHQAGRADKLPEWVEVVLAAKWYGAPPWELMAQEDWKFWKEAGLLFRSIESEAKEKANKRDR